MDDQEYTDFFIKSVLDKKDFFTSYSIFSYLDLHTQQTRYFRMTTDANHDRFPTSDGLMKISKQQVWDYDLKKSGKSEHFCSIESVKLVQRYATDKMSRMFLFLGDARNYQSKKYQRYASRFGWSRFCQELDLDPCEADMYNYQQMCFKLFATTEYANTLGQKVNAKRFNNLCGSDWEILTRKEKERGTPADHNRQTLYTTLKEEWKEDWKRYDQIVRGLSDVPASQYKKGWKSIRDDYRCAEEFFNRYEQLVNLVFN